jgi:hypothetical protein
MPNKLQANIGTVDDFLKGGPPNFNQIMLANNMNPDALRANATSLREKEWEQLDAAVVHVARPALSAINDLTSRGLVTRFNGLAKTVFDYDVASDTNVAAVDMKLSARGHKDNITYTRKYIPLPIIHKDYDIDIRLLNASRSANFEGGGNEPLDVAHAQDAAYQVAYMANYILMNGYSTYSHGGGVLYGYIDHPSGEDVSIGSTHWDHSAGVGPTVLANVNSMLAKEIANHRIGPYGIYIPQGYATVMNLPYSSTYPSTTIGDMIRNIAEIAFVKVDFTLPADTVVMVDLNPISVDMLIGLDITNFEWGQIPMDLQFKVACIMVPRIKVDGNGKTGIVVIS